MIGSPRYEFTPSPEISMSGIEQANGHKPTGLTHVFDPAFAAAPKPDPAQLTFDLEARLRSVVALQSRAPEDAFSSSYLGTEREGNGVIIGQDGLVVTIGYLISEADEILLGTESGNIVPAQSVAYDWHTGFGLVRAAGDLGAEPLVLGSADNIVEGGEAIVAARGGAAQAILAEVTSKREFAGYWEYMLDEAIFTAPPHPRWSGAALLDAKGELVGVGSLFVQDARPGETAAPGNMFIPIDLLKRVIDDLLAHGESSEPPRPWIGVYSMEALGRVLVTSVSGDSPAEIAGVEAGDVIVAVNGREVRGLADLYRKVWATGPAGVTVELGVLRDSDVLTIVVETVDRRQRMKRPRSH
jgi:S1-C subfamily serine protease